MFAKILYVQFTPPLLNLDINRPNNWYQELGLVFCSSVCMMFEFKMPFAEGVSINRPPMFGGVNYAFWKIRMKFFMESIDMGI